MDAVMLITDNLGELSAMEKALAGDYRVIPESKPRHAVDRLRKLQTTPVIVVLDAQSAGIDAFEALNEMQTTKKLREISVLIISEETDHSTELEAYQLGACDFLVRPFPPELLKRKVDFYAEIVRQKKELESTRETLRETEDELQSRGDSLRSTANNAVQAIHQLEYFLVGILGDLITHKDGYTGMHCKRVSVLVGILLRQMMKEGTAGDIPPQDMELILMAAQLFDMGKIGIPDAILEKTGKYTDEEFEKMKAHTVLAAETIQRFSYLVPNSSFVAYTYQMARSHHEQWCGNGYPDGLAGVQIPFLARVIAVCDTYDALMTRRAYKQELSHDQAYYIIKQSSGVQFDPQVVEAFQRVHREFYRAQQSGVND